jgi:uncharacterized protein YoxC
VKEIQEISKKANSVLEHLLTLHDDLNKAANVGKVDLLLEIITDLQNRIQELETEVEFLAEKMNALCKSDGKCCVALELFGKAFAWFKKCFEALSESAENIKKVLNACEQCIFFSDTTGICVKLRTKVLSPVPPCGGKYFRPAKEGSKKVSGPLPTRA